jgi:hypothetical protein
MIEIKLSKKWCNRTVQALSLPSKPFYAFNDFLEDKIGDHSGYGGSDSVLVVWMQIVCTVMGSILTISIWIANDYVYEWGMLLATGLIFLLIPIGLVGLAICRIISNNISISCRCDEE